MTEETWYDRDIDYLGNIKERLGDLAGYGTLANELIQNAEDARATTITFDLSDVALTVTNDARISDCATIGRERHCPRARTSQRSCDWHNLTWIAAGQKDGRPETIGKFGVGLLAMYQITDLPTIVSGRHWEFHELKPAQRIREVCKADCSHFPEVAGTLFRFPFATDPDSKLRKRLGQRLLDWRSSKQIEDALVEAAPLAILFLRHVTRIDILREGSRVLRVDRLPEEGEQVSTVLVSARDVATWHVIEGDFSDAGASLKAKYGPERIDAVRGTTVRVAVPSSGQLQGVLYAGLPTSTLTGLPFHIDATFFPESNRKRVIDDQLDFRTEWNQAALEAASQAVATRLDALRSVLTPTAFWNVVKGIDSGKDIAAASRLVGPAQFWPRVASKMKEGQFGYDVRGQWVATASAPVPFKTEEYGRLETLRSTGIAPMDAQVREIIASGSLVRNELGTCWLTIDHLVQALQSRSDLRNSEGRLLPVEAVKELWDELATLLDTAAAQNRATPPAEQALQGCNIALTIDGGYRPLGQTFAADDETRRLIESLDLDVPLLDAGLESHGRIASLCPRFGVAEFAAAAESAPRDSVEARWRETAYRPSALLAWLADRIGEVQESPSLLQRLRALPLFPSTRGLAPLSDLAMPGAFQDPLRIAKLIEIEDLPRHKATLSSLGVRELTVSEFATVHVPLAFQEDVPAETARKVAHILALNALDLEGNDRARAALLGVPFIECVDGGFRAPDAVVQDSEAARRVLGADGPLAALPANAPLRHRELWAWLGIPADPTPLHLEERIDRVALGGGDWDDTVKDLEHICLFLNGQLGNAAFDPLLTKLKTKAWLLSHRDLNWHRPGELHAEFQRVRFESEGTFIALSAGVQRSIAPLMDRLGIITAAPTNLIVKHLIRSADEGKRVNEQVWVGLNENAGDPALALLRHRPCLLIGNDPRYWNPDNVFRSGPDFGGLRAILAADGVSPYAKFLDAVGVRRAPATGDAVEVLREVAQAGPNLDGEGLSQNLRVAVYQAWSLISSELSDDTAELVRTMSQDRVAVDMLGCLEPPGRLLIEDRPGLPALFEDDLQRRVIPFDPAIARGLRAAGARDLSEAVSVVLLDDGDHPRDEELLALLRERWPGLHRVVEGLAADDDERNGIETIRCFTAAGMRIVYEVAGPDGTERSRPITPQAIFDVHTRSLYVDRTQGYPWTHLARELAAAVCGQRGASRVAFGFLEVLRARSWDEAQGSLDDLGIPRVAAADIVESGEAESVTLAGDRLEEDDGAAWRHEPADDDGSDDGRDRSAEQSQGQEGDGGHGHEEGTPAGHASPDDAAGGHGQGGGWGTSGRPRSLAPARNHGGRTSSAAEEVMLRSWVQRRGPDESEPMDEATKARRLATDAAGVERATAYERMWGREPKVMAHDNEGYDIESYQGGQLVRYIEVKSLSGEWRNDAPSLSSRQHDHAVRERDRFWLYVVELAGQPGERLHAIQDPIGRATHFGFDPGWRDVALDRDSIADETDEDFVEVEDEAVEA